MEPPRAEAPRAEAPPMPAPLGPFGLPIVHAIPISTTPAQFSAVGIPGGPQPPPNQNLPRQPGLQFTEEGDEATEGSGPQATEGSGPQATEGSGARQWAARRLGVSDAEYDAMGEDYEAKVPIPRARTSKTNLTAALTAAALTAAAVPSLLTCHVRILPWTEAADDAEERRGARRARDPHQ